MVSRLAILRRALFCFVVFISSCLSSVQPAFAWWGGQSSYSPFVLYNGIIEPKGSWSLYIEDSDNIPLVLDNLTGTQNIFEARDDGSAVITIGDGGFLGIGDSISSTKFLNISHSFSTGAVDIGLSLAISAESSSLSTLLAFAANGEANHSSGTINSIFGFQGGVKITASGGTTSTAIGLNCRTLGNNGITATVGTLAGVQTMVDAEDLTVTNAIGGYFQDPLVDTGSITRQWALLASGDVQVNQDKKLILEGNINSKGDSYFVFNLSTTDIDLFIDNTRVQTWDDDQIDMYKALQMGDDNLIAVDVNSGLTASTTQSQGQGALTAQVNEISTVANEDDTLTLPSAVTGTTVGIINNGANTLQVFPASGDDLGLGVDVAGELGANERVAFVAYNATNWAKESTTETIHAEMHDEDNTDEFVINDAGGDFHSYHTNGLAAGDLANWTFDSGGAGTSHAITGIVQAGGNIRVTVGDAHGLAVGDIVSQTNLVDAAYIGVFIIVAVPTTTEYLVSATYTATDTGTMEQAATLEANAVAVGVYSFAYYISATPVGNNETFDFQLYRGATAVVGSKIRSKFGAANDFSSMAGGGVVSISEGDKISLALSNEDSAANIIVRNLTLVLVRL